MAAFDQADIFLVPLLDGTFCVGQIVDPTATATAALCLLTRIAQPDHGLAAPLALTDVQSVLLAETSALRDGTWPIIGFEQLPNVMQIFDWRHERVMKYYGHFPHEAPFIEAFLNASFGLYPWDGFGDPAVFAALLIDPKTPPPLAVLKSGRPAR